MLAIPLTQRRLFTEQGISQASKKFTLLLPQLLTARPVVTSSSIADCLARPICATLRGSLDLGLSTGIIASFNVGFTGV